MEDYSNAGWLTLEGIKDEYTLSHEYGHGMGWYDKSQNPSKSGLEIKWQPWHAPLRSQSGNGTHDIFGTLSEDGTHSIPGIMAVPQFDQDMPTNYDRPPYGEEYVSAGPIGNTKFVTKRLVTARDISLLNRAWTSNAIRKVGPRRYFLGNVSNTIRGGSNGLNAYDFNQIQNILDLSLIHI